MEPDGKYYAILDSSKTKRGQIEYNIKEGEDLFKEQYVVVRKKSSKDRDSEDKNSENRDIENRDSKDGDRLDVKEYYILVVRPTSIDGEYKRVRVGLIQSDYVVRQRLNVRVV